MFKNRLEAGTVLAKMFSELEIDDPCLLALPRGGVVVASPVAEQLNTELNILITRKIGHPANKEVAIGAVMPDGSAVFDEFMVSLLGLSRQQLDAMAGEEYRELQRRQLLYTGSGVFPDVAGRQAVLVDDGIATGYTVRAAVTWLAKQSPAKIILAVPVAPPEIIAQFAASVDEVVCPLQPDDFMAVGMYYRDFGQVSDEDVLAILRKNR